METEVRRGVPELVADSSQAAVKEAEGTKRAAKKNLVTKVLRIKSQDGVDIYMLVEREYPLSRGVLTLMMVVKLMVDQHSKMANELL
nr:hypothetical protein [Tanacetum cinerariifolium]